MTQITKLKQLLEALNQIVLRATTVFISVLSAFYTQKTGPEDAGISKILIGKNRKPLQNN